MQNMFQVESINTQNTNNNFLYSEILLSWIRLHDFYNHLILEQVIVTKNRVRTKKIDLYSYYDGFGFFYLDT